MGTNANAWVDHRLDLDELTALPHRLNDVCPVAECWIWEPGEKRFHEKWAYEVVPTPETITEGSCLLDGGGFHIAVTARCMCIGSLVRWRGFLLYPRLRARVRIVTHRIATAVSASQLVWVPDWALDGSEDEASIHAIRTKLEAKWGPAQSELEQISDDVRRRAEYEPPAVWFRERAL